jgi:hypothetical protein
MAKRGKGDAADHAPEPPGERRGGDLSLVLPLSLLAGGLVSYPSLSAAAGSADELMKAVTLFLAASLVAMVGIGINVLLFRSFLAKSSRSATSDPTGRTPGGAGAQDGEGSEEGGPVPTLAIERELDNQAGDIDQALAATDALVHE